MSESPDVKPTELHFTKHKGRTKNETKKPKPLLFKAWQTSQQRKAILW